MAREAGWEMLPCQASRGPCPLFNDVPPQTLGVFQTTADQLCAKASPSWTGPKTSRRSAGGQTTHQAPRSTSDEETSHGKCSHPRGKMLDGAVDRLDMVAMLRAQHTKSVMTCSPAQAGVFLWGAQRMPNRRHAQDWLLWHARDG